MKTIKEVIIGLLEELKTTKIRSETLTIEVQFPTSFDSGQLGVYHKELYDQFTTKEQVIKEKVVVNTKDLKRFYPDIYEKYVVKLTPRLIIRT